MKIRKFGRSPLGIATMGMALMIGCGDANFSGVPTVQEIQPASGDATRGDEPASEPDPRLPEVIVGETIDESETTTDLFLGAVESSRTPVDIIFVVDTSSSMSDEKEMLEDTVKDFLERFNQSGSVDAQVFMMGQGFDFPEMDPERFFTIEWEVDSWNALVRTKEFFSNEGVLNNLLRADSRKEVVIVTDDNSADMDSESFLTFLRENKAQLGTLKINGFVWLPESIGKTKGGPSWCTKAATGTQYMAVAEDPEFGGDLYDLCTPDWSALMESLAAKIITENAKLAFQLTGSVDEDEDIVVSIDGEEVDSDRWSFEPDTRYIRFKGDYAPQAGQVLLVTYTKLDKEKKKKRKNRNKNKNRASGFDEDSDESDDGEDNDDDETED